MQKIFILFLPYLIGCYTHKLPEIVYPANPNQMDYDPLPASIDIDSRAGKCFAKVKAINVDTSFWTEVVCGSLITPTLINKLQSDLMSLDYAINAEELSKFAGPSTKLALIEFQKKNGLPYGQLTYPSLELLNKQALKLKK